MIACFSGVAAVSPGPAHAQTVGQLVVVSEPSGARVQVDGRDAGIAPVTVPDLVPGAHLVVATSATGASAQRVVEVEAGRSVLVELAISEAPPAVDPAATPAAGDPPPAPPVLEPVDATPVAPDAATAAPAELAPTDLAAGRAASAPVDHLVEEPIAATGFPGLLGNTLGIRLDVPIYVETPIRNRDPRTGRDAGSQTLALARLTIEGGLGPIFGLVGAIDFNNVAFGLGLSMNVPGWIPLARQIAIALQPRLQVIVYGSTSGAVLMSGEATLRIGASPIPNLVLGGQVGLVVVGVIALDSPLTEGVYVGPMVGGGVEWAFY